MQKIQIYADGPASGTSLPHWDGTILMVGRVPCIGEHVRVPNERAMQVVRVIHHVESEHGTVAGVTLRN